MMKREELEAEGTSANTPRNSHPHSSPPPGTNRTSYRHREQQHLTADDTSIHAQLAQSQHSQFGDAEDGTGQSPDGHAAPVTTAPAWEPTVMPLSAPLGPMSARPLLPARKKPGRKPIPEQEVGDRRRKQNRESQRSFRQRKQDKFSEALNDKMALQRELKERELEFQRALEGQKRQMQEAMEAERKLFQEQMEAEKRHIREALEARHRDYETGSHDLRKRAEDAEQRAANLDAKLAQVNPSSQHTTDNVVRLAPFNSHVRNTGSSGGGVADITPTEEYEETDFTATWSRKPIQINNTNSTYELDENTASFGLCGFCTDAGNCQCRATENPEPVVEPSAAAGNCNGCLQNPSRQACCRQIANSASFASENTLAPMMSCSRFLDKAEARAETFPSISQLFGPGNALKAYRSGSGGFHVSEQEAAEALQTLSGTSPD